MDDQEDNESLSSNDTVAPIWNGNCRRDCNGNDNSTDESPQQRPRVIDNFEMPEPFSDNAITCAALRRTNIVQLNDLTCLGAEPARKGALVAQILRIIVHNPNIQNSNAQTYTRPRGLGPVCPSSMPYQRLILCRVFSESEGHLLFYMMESPSLNKNSNLWLNNVELCDNGVITVGTVFRIISPLPASNYLRGDIPLIETHQPVIVLKVPSSFLQVTPLDNLQG